MSQTETPPQKTRAAKTPKPLCRIHNEVGHLEVDGIRQNVCVNDEDFIQYTDGKHYCLFHLPTKDKDIEKFEGKFRARLKAVEKKLVAIEELPEEEREHAKDQISYNFRYVWFPLVINLNNYKFSASASFYSATFSASASFYSATFLDYADFDSAIFSAGAEFSAATFLTNADFDSAMFSASVKFSEATFSGFVYFRSATFSAEAYFDSATFSAYTYFDSATFSTDADFDSAKFLNSAYFRLATFTVDAYFRSVKFSVDADFSSAKFLETSQILFYETKFCSSVDFSKAEFDGFVEFEGDIFLDRKQVREVKAELNNENIKDTRNRF